MQIRPFGIPLSDYRGFLQIFLLTFVFSVFFSFEITAQDEWTYEFNEGLDNSANGCSYFEEEGNLYIAGTIDEASSLLEILLSSLGLINAGKKDGYLTKLDESGNSVWMVSIGSGEDDELLDVVVSDDGIVYATGYVSEDGNIQDATGNSIPFALTSSGSHADMITAAFTTEGEYIWHKTEGGEKEDYGLAMTCTSTGIAVISCYNHNSNSSGDNGNPEFFGNSDIPFYGNGDIAVLKYDSDGNGQWYVTIGSDEEDFNADDRSFQEQDLGIDSYDDQIYIIGSYAGNLVHFQSNADAVDATFDLTSTDGDSDIFVASINDDGALYWTKSLLNGDNPTFGYGIAADCDGLYVGGHIYDFLIDESSGTEYDVAGRETFFLSKLTPSDGEMIWTYTLNPSIFFNANSEFNVLTGIDIDENGNIFACGYYKYSNFSSDIQAWYGWIDHSGNILSFDYINNDGFDVFTDIVSTTDGKVHVVGQLEDLNGTGNFYSKAYQLQFGTSSLVDCCPNPATGGIANADNLTPCESESVNLTLESFNGSIQWQESFDFGTNWNDIPNADTSDFVYTVNQDVYLRAVLTTECGTEYSNTVQVNMIETIFSCTYDGTNINASVDSDCSFELPNYVSLVTATPCISPSQTPAPGTLLSPGIHDVNIENSFGDTLCSFTVEVTDNAAPTISNCNDIIVPSQDVCSYSVPSWTDMGIVISDNCSFTVEQIPAEGTSISGDTVLTITATDEFGNNSSCDINIIFDLLETCPEDTVVGANSDCQFILPDYRNLLGICNVDLIEQHPWPGTPIGTGINVIEFAASETSVVLCSFTIEVVDTTAPLINYCPTDTSVYLSDDCNYIMEDFASDMVFSENCTGVITGQYPLPGTPIFSSTEVLIEVKDYNNNSNFCTFDLNLIDTVAPVILCDEAVTLSSAPDTCGAFVDLSRPSFISECSQDSWSIKLDGNDDYVAISNFSFYGNYQELTVDTWVRTLSTNNGIIASYDRSEYWRLEMEADGTVSWHISTDDGVETIQSSIAINDGAWHRISGTFNNGQVRLFIDENLEVESYRGTEFGTSILRYGFIGVGSEASTFNGAKSPGQYFDGQIADFRIYDFALDEDLLESNKCLEESLALQVHYGIEEQGGNILYDWSGSNRNGIINTGADSPEWNNTRAYSCIELSHNIPLNQFFPIGTTQIDWVATDMYGNSGSCTQEINIIDSISPSIVCPESYDLYLTDACTFTIPNLTDDISYSDNCSVFSVGQSPPWPTEYNYSDLDSIVLMVSDEAGNNSTCVVQLNVLDSIAPEISCPDTITVPTNNGCLATGIDIGTPVVTDNCGASSVLTAIPLSYNLGFNTVFRTAIDEFGNTASCQQVIEVLDIEPPTITCPPNISQGVDSGESFATVMISNPITNDNCGIDYVINDFNGTDNASGQYPIGTTQVTWSVFDLSGNFSTCVMQVVVSDTDPPTITCPADQIVESDPGLCEAIVSISQPLTFDNSSVALVQNDYNGTNDASDTYPVGTTNIIWTAIDDEGNSSSCSMQITVVDSEAPSITCPGDQVIMLDEICDHTIPDYISSLVVADNCSSSSDIILNQNPAPGSLGTDSQWVTIEAEDEAGNISTCSFELIFDDSINPTISCIGDQQLDSDQNCEAVLPDYSLSLTYSDNCTSLDLLVVNQSPAPGTIVSGITTVVVTVSDQAGNNSQCNFEVEVNDVSPPTIISGECPSNDFLFANEDCQAIVPNYSDSVSLTDNCSAEEDITILQNPLPGTLISGTQNVSLVYFDEAGNSDSCVFNVSVSLDTLSPYFISIPEAQSVFTDENCQFSIPDFTSDVISADNCDSNPELSQFPPEGTVVSGHNNTITIELTLSDNSGNLATEQFEITLIDSVPPVMICPNDTIISVSGSCSESININNAISSDSCGSVIVTNDYNGTNNASGVYPLGTTEITWTAEDIAGNISMCISTVELIDQTAPTLICPPDTTHSTSSIDCNAYLSLAQPLVDENCGLLELTNDYNDSNDSSDSYPIGSNLVIWTATDENGNTGTCSQTITITDEISPTITCPDDISVNNTAGMCSAFITSDLPLLSDNCGSVSFINNYNASEDASDLYPVGITEVIWYVIDESDNSNSCTQQITVIDAEIPEINCPDTLIFATSAGLCEASLNLPSPGTSDNCEVLGVMNNYTGTSNANGTYPAGITNLTWTVQDVHGNSNTCSQTILVQDLEGPQITCPEDLVVNTDSNCQYQIEDYTDLVSTTDNCSGSINITQLPSPGEMMTGPTTVLILAEDEFGNTSSCSFDILVEDIIAPTAQCQDIQIELDNQGEATLFPDLINAGSFDNCNIEDYVISTESFNCVDLGTQSVELTVYDASGNESSCFSQVEIVDLTEPEILSCANDMLLESADTACGDWILLSEISIPQAEDNCGLWSIHSDFINEIAGQEINFLDYLDEEIFIPVQVIEVEWIIEDNSGNISYCYSEISMIDNTNPVMNVEEEVLLILPQDHCMMDYSYEVDPEEVTDNCEVGSYTEVQTDTDLTIGTNINAYTGFDIYGNSIDEFIVQTLYIIDTVAPVIECSDTLTLYSDSGLCGTEVDLNPEISSDESCPENVVISGGYSGWLDVGEHIIEYSAYDMAIQDLIDDPLVPVSINDSGQAVFADTLVFDYTSTCSQVVLVLDTINPWILNSTDTTFLSSDSGSIEAQIDIPLAEDNCLIQNIWVDFDGYSQNYLDSLYLNGNFEPGLTELNWEISDNFGNTTTIQTYVLVEDSGAPIFTTCPDNQEVELDEFCSFTLEDYTDLVEVFDLTDDSPIITQSPEPETTIISDTEIVLTATDFSGNSNTCTFQITVSDNTAPNITCNPELSVCDVMSETDFPVFSDDCSEVFSTQATTETQTFENWNDILDFEFTDLITIEFFVEDSYGNTNSCTTEITVVGDSFLWTDLPEHICDGDEIVLETSHNNYTSSTLSDNTFVEDGIYNAEISSDTDFTDIITLTVCDLEYQQTVIVNSIPEPQILMPEEACANCDIQLITNDFEYSGVIWSSSDDNVLFDNNLNLAASLFTNESNFDTITSTISLFVDNDGCTGETSFEITLYEPISFEDLSAGEDQELFDSESTYLDGFYLGPGTSNWTLSDESSDLYPDITDSSNPFTTVNNLSVGDYYFVLTANNGVCESVSDTVNIWINGMIPNGFSPNGNGVNDFFEIDGLDASADNELIVFNRWGSEVYRKSHYDNGWNGTNQNGETLVDDTYFYVFRIGNKNYEGFVVIKRN